MKFEEITLENKKCRRSWRKMMDKHERVME